MNKKSNKEPIILALETSGRVGSAALAQADKLLGEITFDTPVRHSSEIFPAVNNLLEKSNLQPGQINHIYISIGPGSFTGLRIAATFAKIMHLAHNHIKIVAVDTLDCIAANAAQYLKQKKTTVNKIAAILDAKRGQFFTAVYKQTSVIRHPSPALRSFSEEGSVIRNDVLGFADCWEKILDDCLLTPQQFIEQFAAPADPVWLLGEGLVYYRNNFKSPGLEFIDERFWFPKASVLHQIGYNLALAGCFADPVTLKPKYLQRPDIKLKKQY